MDLHIFACYCRGFVHLCCHVVLFQRKEVAWIKIFISERWNWSVKLLSPKAGGSAEPFDGYSQCDKQSCLTSQNSSLSLSRGFCSKNVPSIIHLLPSNAFRDSFQLGVSFEHQCIMHYFSAYYSELESLLRNLLFYRFATSSRFVLVHHAQLSPHNCNFQDEMILVRWETGIILRSCVFVVV